MFTSIELLRLKSIMTKVLENDEAYEKQYGNDWGSTKQEDEKIMQVINLKLQGVA